MHSKLRLTFILLVAVSRATTAQVPFRSAVESRELRFSPDQPTIHYTMIVDSTDLSAFSVMMKVKNAPDTVRLAFNAHPEYDDKYWRYLSAMQIEGEDGNARIDRMDSSLFRVAAKGGDFTLTYRIVLPQPQESPRAAWQPYLTPTGGLAGGPHAFMYIVGQELAPSHVTVHAPSSWRIATGLVPTSDPTTFMAPTTAVLVESPIFVGKFSDWKFDVDGVPHRVVYWRSPAPQGQPFDSVEFVRSIKAYVEQAVVLFGRAPWREYTFIFQDNAYGGLEHANSVTLGAPSSALASDAQAMISETAHEFFHAWNLMRIRPGEYRTVDYKPQPPTTSLWFSEGLTIFYADLLSRRAGLHAEGATRLEHLEELLSRYVGNPASSALSAEKVSSVEYNSSPDALGDFSGSTHLQGEVYGNLLDMIIRSRTNGMRSMDDVMRLMLARFSGDRGFTGRDVEAAVEEVCSCDVTPFFDAHIRAASPVDFNSVLSEMGLRVSIVDTIAVNENGTPVPDLNIWGWQDHEKMRLRISHPQTIWGRAGVHTGDELVSINGVMPKTWPELRSVIRQAKVGDTTKIVLKHNGVQKNIAVKVTPLQLRRARIKLLPAQTPQMQKLFREWSNSK
jgi:predicted metalloprotease with PDZ domain